MNVLKVSPLASRIIQTIVRYINSRWAYLHSYSCIKWPKGANVGAMGNRWVYISRMIVAIIDVTIDMHLQRMSTCAIENEPNIMTFPRKHFDKGHLLRPLIGLFKDTYACSQLNSCKCKMLRESVEYPANEERLHVDRAHVSPVQRTPTLHE